MYYDTSVKYLIFCPYGARTGGPEALLQLSDSLIRNGFDAELWLITQGEIDAISKFIADGGSLFENSFKVSERSNPIAEYARYQQNLFRGYSQGQKLVAIIPETYTWMTPALLKNRLVVWWLSVDNAFESLTRHNLNFLRLPNVKHVAQSAYAMQFAASLGLDPSLLTDYTTVDGEASPVDSRRLRLAINANQKVIFNLDGVIQDLQIACPGLEVIKIYNLKREEVYEAFRTSRLFIDLGNFPGKDRMIREALALGANVILARVGSGALFVDYPIPDLYKISPSELSNVALLAQHMLINPASHSQRFQEAREVIREEKRNFDAEVLDFFCQLQ
jgi:hypothetical protein